MLTLLATLAFTGPPTLDCTTVSVEIPGEDTEAERPKGFQWEGWQPLGVLADGRTVLTRGSALEGLSRKDLRRQHEDRAPDRVSRVALIAPDGKLDHAVTIRRGSPLEVVAMPGGGAAIAHTSGGGTAIDHIDDRGVWSGTTVVPRNAGWDVSWRKDPVLDGGVPRITPLTTGQVVTSARGRTLGLDLRTHQALGVAELWPTTIQSVFPKRGDGELLIVDRNKRLVWLDASLKERRVEPCEGCRATGLQVQVDLARARPDRWQPSVMTTRAATARFDGDGIVVSWWGASGLDDKAREAPVSVPFTLADSGRLAWWLRTGPWGTAVVSVAGARHTVHLVQPGVAEPVWSWTAPEGLVPEGGHAIADALGPWVRIRVLDGSGEDAKVTGVVLADPASERRTEAVAPEALPEPLRPALVSPWYDRVTDGPLLVQPVGDAELIRTEPGPSTATFRRCEIRIP